MYTAMNVHVKGMYLSEQTSARVNTHVHKCEGMCVFHALVWTHCA